MFAKKFLDQLEAHSDQLTREFMQKITRSGKCTELLKRVPAEEEEQTIRHIYQDMTKWLLNANKSADAEYYVELGKRRAKQGVPFSELLSGVCAARQYFWEYVERETLLDQPADFWGGVKLLHLLDSCLDSGLYFVAIGYSQASKEGSRAA
jgi:hypothetical protein